MYRCTYPWTHFSLLPTRISPCCNLHIDHSAAIGTPADLLAAINAPDMVRLRQKLLDGETQGTPCEHCRIANTTLPASGPYARARAALRNKTAVLDYIVPVLAFFSSYKCNLRCIMCCSKGNHFSDQQTIHVDYSQLFDSITPNETALLVFCGGGEIFYTQSGRDILTAISRARHLDTVHKELTTNGLLLHNHRDLLSTIRNIEYNISIDGAGQDYENIRSGARWDSVRENVDLLCDIAQTKPDITIKVSCLIMRSSLHSILDLTAFCIKRALRMHLSYVQYEATEDLSAFTDDELGTLGRIISELQRLQPQHPTVLSKQTLDDIDAVLQTHLANRQNAGPCPR